MGELQGGIATSSDVSLSGLACHIENPAHVRRFFSEFPGLHAPAIQLVFISNGIDCESQG